ncbi:alpha/beta fold hydrolase [Rapidithrix thailandica]|uniref:Alpha/beta fold hydrolase n=1 Tax=Rapidithrix thailandica TaxID=413964 RepID=A0AAW9SE48_9BACT
MKKQLLVLLLLIGLVAKLQGQSEKTVTVTTVSGTLEGTLQIPGKNEKMPVALIIAGSGPTDRNGNNPMMTNNSLKMLALQLSQEGIASLRYDKRGVGNSRGAGLKEAEMRFEHFIEDAKAWIHFLKKENAFTQIVVIGHSEGSLVGMIAAQHAKADRYISIAGSGRPAGQLIREQMQAQPPVVREQALPVLDKLEKGDTVESTPPMLQALFRPGIQPYLISWFKYDPQKEIAKLAMPTLILQGTTDIQVSTKDAEALSQANPQAKLSLIEGMNHVLKEAPQERMQNLQTYNQPDLPLKQEVVEEIANFVN